MSEIKISFSGHEDEFMSQNDSIAGETDILSLFNDNFMKAYTKFDNLSDFISASGKNFLSEDSWNNIQNGDIDSFIQSNSEFDSWVDMYTTAGNEFLNNLLSE